MRKLNREPEQPQVSIGSMAVAIERWETDGGMSCQAPSDQERPLQELLADDYHLITEGMRRLHDGIWSLVDEDLLYAVDLFQRVHMACRDHIAFEEQNLPWISENICDGEVSQLCSQMYREHDHLNGLLEAAQFELSETRPIAFKAVILALRRALNNHMELEIFIPYDAWNSTLDHSALLRMNERLDAGIL